MSKETTAADRAQKGAPAGKKRERNVIARLADYAGPRKKLLYVSAVLSILSTAVGIVPYLYIRRILRLSLEPQLPLEQIRATGWLVLYSSFATMLLYFLALGFSHLFAFHVESGIRSQSMERFFRMPLGFFQVHSSGKLRKTVDDNASRTHQLLAHNTPDLAGAVAFPFLMLPVLFFYDWRMGLVALVALVASFVCLMPMYSGKNRDCVQIYMDAQEHMNASAVEFVRGIPVVKVFRQSVYSFREFREAIAAYSNYSLTYCDLARPWMTISNVLIYMPAFLLVLLGLLLISLGEPLSATLLNVLFYTLFATLCATTFLRLAMTAMGTMHAQEVVSRIDRLFEFPEMVYGTKAEPPTSAAHGVVYSNVHFRYPGQTEDAVAGVSLDIPAGTVLALVGPSGGGKTTLASLLPRFYDLQSGEITLAGTPVAEYSREALMNQISFVFQNQKLMSGTLRRNLLLARENATEKELLEACHRAQCDEILARLPEGLDTVVGAEGSYLSGGEEQRFLLARAFLKNAPVLILDEATAFADPESEHQILQAMHELMRGKTVLLIAHRLSTVVDADQIALIEEGTVKELGKHEELVARGGTYARMWEAFCRSTEWRLDGTRSTHETDTVHASAGPTPAAASAGKEANV